MSIPLRALAVLLGLGALPVVMGTGPAAAPPLHLHAPGDDNLPAYLDRAAISATANRRFHSAAKAARSGRDQTAEVGFLDVARTTPVLADWAYMLAADAAARRGDTARVRQHLQSSGEWLSAEWGWRVRVRAVQARSGARAAAALALQEADGLQMTSSTLQAQRMGAELMLAARDTQRAIELLRDLVKRDVDPTLIRSAAVTLARISAEPSDLLQSARVLANAGDMRGVAALLPAIQRIPSLAGNARGQLRSDLARYYLDARRYAEAERIGADLATDPTEPVEVRAQGRVILGRALLRRGQRAPAIVQLERVLEENAPTAVAEAAYVLGDLETDPTSARARELFERSATSAPRTSAGTESLMRLGIAAFARGQKDSALHWFELARSGAPRFHQRATYWSGRAQLERGDPSAGDVLRSAMTEDPVSYYAFRAAEQLKTSSLTLAPAPVRNDTVERRMERAFARYELLRKAELFDLAGFELERVRRTFSRSTDALYALAERMHAAGQTQSAISLGRGLQRDRGTWDERLLRIVYPLPFRELIVSEAQRQGVDPFLAAALIRQESAFNPRAISVAGARGLMQVMPQTGRTVARKSSVSKYRVARLYEPALNVKLGMQHLKSLVQAHAGRLTYVLSAYNAGPNRLNQWLSFPEAIDDELFAERIPFAETRDYVRIVQQNAHIYRRVYGPQPAESTTDFRQH